ncbi:MAG: FAD-dependent oxidoreductase, partial [Acidobacteriota bacterium]
DFDDTGALLVDRPDAPTAAFETAARRAGEGAIRLDGRAARDLVPDLGPDVEGFLFMPGEHRVDNRRVLEALGRVVEGAGVTLRRGRTLRRLVPGASGVRAEADGHSTSAGAAVICAGAWTSEVSGVQAPPVHPVKGQMLRFAAVDWPLSGCLRAGHFYAARRRSGGLLVGATVEPEAGFDVEVTGDGLASLLGFTREVLPGLLTRPVVETWAGVRPGSPDGRPLIGPVNDGVWVASGHYRNGVLLTPWTARTVADWLVDGVPPDDATAALLAPGRRGVSQTSFQY